MFKYNNLVITTSISCVFGQNYNYVIIYIDQKTAQFNQFGMSNWTVLHVP